jgi:hypothetical protein
MEAIHLLLRITFSCTFSELLGSYDLTRKTSSTTRFGGLSFLVRRVSYRLVYGLDIKVGTSFYFCKETSGIRNIIYGFVSLLVLSIPSSTSFIVFR